VKTKSILFFCGQPLANQPISQRIVAFGKYLKSHDWNVQLTSVDCSFSGFPITHTDRTYGIEVVGIGPAHYRQTKSGEREQLPAGQYLRKCLKIARELEKRIEARQPDVIMLSTTLPASLVAALYLYKFRSKLWMDIDDWSSGQFSARGGGKIVGQAYGILESLIPRIVRQITVCSDSLKEIYPRAIHIPNFVNLAEVPERTRKHIFRDRVKVAFASGLTNYHGHTAFLDALSKRKQECFQLEIKIIGAGDNLEKCKRIVSQNKMDDLVKFTGNLSREDMLTELINSDIGIVPLWNTRLHRARFPLKILDYLASGCTLVASEVGSVKSVFRHGHNALLSRPGDMQGLIDNLLLLVNDPRKRDFLSRAGDDMVQNYTEELICNKWILSLNG
jgi:glycosyltransferase involved in cell wall biosynthesis